MGNFSKPHICDSFGYLFCSVKLCLNKLTVLSQIGCMPSKNASYVAPYRVTNQVTKIPLQLECLQTRMEEVWRSTFETVRLAWEYFISLAQCQRKKSVRDWAVCDVYPFRSPARTASIALFRRQRTLDTVCVYTTFPYTTPYAHFFGFTCFRADTQLIVE